MYASFLHTVFSFFRLVGLFTLLLLGAVQEGYGQRVYADVQQNNYTPLLASVNNAHFAVDNDTLNSSTLSVTLGLLGIVSAQQNLQFVNVIQPTINTPVIIKFSAPGALLDLLGGFSVQRTRNTNDALVLPSYGGTGLLELLNLFGGGNVATLVIPPTGAQFDGVRLTVNTTLGVARTANYYYAFYITPPQIQPSLTLCSNSEGTATITNFQSGYTYRLYSQQTGGTEIGTATTSNQLTIPSSLAAGTYWLEAREGDLYPSARTAIEVVRNSVTGGTIGANQAVCAGDIPVTLSTATASTGDGALTYHWQRKTSGGYTDILGTISETYSPPALFETTTYRRVTTSTLNGVACSAFSNDITITVQPLPTITLLPIPPICEGETTATLAYSTTTNNPDQYSITWDSGTPTGFTNIMDAPLPSSPIGLSIPETAVMGTYTGILRVKNSASGCESGGTPFSVQVLPQPGKPHLTITDVQN